MVAKAGLGLIGLSAISVGGVALTKPSWLGMGNGMPECHSLASDSDFSSAGYGENFGSKHKYYLAGVTHKGNGTDQKDNKSWWEWSFERLKKDGIKIGKFAVVGTTASDTSNIKVDKEYDGKDTNPDTKALNQVCKAAYKAATTSVKASASETEFNEDHVWKYCSFLGEKPKTISEVQGDSNRYGTGNAIGKNSTYTSKLVSTKGNDKFWEIRDKEFRKESGYGNIENSTDNFFKHEPSKNTTIRELCEKAYKLDTSDDESTTEKPKKDKVVKYCSLSKE